MRTIEKEIGGFVFRFLRLQAERTSLRLRLGGRYSIGIGLGLLRRKLGISFPGLGLILQTGLGLSVGLMTHVTLTSP